MEFTSGVLSNDKNGIYQIIKVDGANNFNVRRSAGISSIEIYNPGLNYNANSYLIFTGGSGQGANATFKINNSGSLITVYINETGNSYLLTPVVTANGSNSIPATFNVITFAGNSTGSVNVSILAT